MLLSRLIRWWSHPSRGSLGHIQVVFYTRPGCHLCAEAWPVLQQLQRDFGFQLRATEIDPDPRLRERYQERVPVIAVDGKDRFWGRINWLLVRRLLAAEVQRLKRKKPPESPPGA